MGAEIKKQSDFKLGPPKIVHQLCFVRAIDVLDCLEFDQHTPFNHQVCLELAYINASEKNWDWNFPLNRKPCCAKRHIHAIAVNGFQKAMSYLVVNVVVDTYNFFSQLRAQQL